MNKKSQPTRVQVQADIAHWQAKREAYAARLAELKEMVLRGQQAALSGAKSNNDLTALRVERDDVAEKLSAIETSLSELYGIRKNVDLAEVAARIEEIDAERAEIAETEKYLWEEGCGHLIEYLLALRQLKGSRPSVVLTRDAYIPPPVAYWPLVKSEFARRLTDLAAPEPLKARRNRLWLERQDLSTRLKKGAEDHPGADSED